MHEVIVSNAISRQGRTCAEPSGSRLRRHIYGLLLAPTISGQTAQQMVVIAVDASWVPVLPASPVWQPVLAAVSEPARRVLRLVAAHARQPDCLHALAGAAFPARHGAGSALRCCAPTAQVCCWQHRCRYLLARHGEVAPSAATSAAWHLLSTIEGRLLGSSFCCGSPHSHAAWLAVHQAHGNSTAALHKCGSSAAARCSIVLGASLPMLLPGLLPSPLSFAPLPQSRDPWHNWPPGALLVLTFCRSASFATRPIHSVCHCTTFRAGYRANPASLSPSLAPVRPVPDVLVNSGNTY